MRGSALYAHLSTFSASNASPKELVCDATRTDPTRPHLPPHASSARHRHSSSVARDALQKIPVFSVLVVIFYPSPPISVKNVPNYRTVHPVQAKTTAPNAFRISTIPAMAVAYPVLSNLPTVWSARSKKSAHLAEKGTSSPAGKGSVSAAVKKWRGARGAIKKISVWPVLRGFTARVKAAWAVERKCQLARAVKMGRSAWAAGKDGTSIKGSAGRRRRGGMEWCCWLAEGQVDCYSSPQLVLDRLFSVWGVFEKAESQEIV